ncbi:DUF4112 domain-containing protein [Chelativorans sp. J32]|uniref:DUF4112 domain-containing protein n=1 Tax=Chelativorans sp. J32 TaxID=935840 RepID=UPI0006849A30|nr:DUF4112 domain-containing protein [Chelativorans sp. J32]
MTAKRASSDQIIDPLIERQIAELDRIARVLDSHWRIPGTSIRFGADAVAGLIPGVGDAGAGLISAYLIYRASRFGVPRSVLAIMIGNVILDTVLGSVPIAGSVFDLFFKANNRNVRHLRRHLEQRARSSAAFISE